MYCFDPIQVPIVSLIMERDLHLQDWLSQVHFFMTQIFFYVHVNFSLSLLGIYKYDMKYS